MAMKKVTKGSGSGQYKDAERYTFEKPGQVLEGYLVEKGSFNFDGKNINRYVVSDDDGEVTFLGSFKLDELLADVPERARVRITYTKKEKLSGGKTLKQFEVECDDEDLHQAS